MDKAIAKQKGTASLGDLLGTMASSAIMGSLMHSGSDNNATAEGSGEEEGVKDYKRKDMKT